MRSNPDLKCDIELIESFYCTPHYSSEMKSGSPVKCFMYAPKGPVKVSSENLSIVITAEGYSHKNQELIHMQFYRREDKRL
jgi:hypothetical protein